MKVSTRGRYSLRLLADIASHQDEGPVSLNDTAKRQELSLKYLELLAAPLVKKGWLITTRGKNGGYQLAQPANEINVADVLEVTDGLEPVECVSNGEYSQCDSRESCTTIGLWRGVTAVLHDYFAKISIADLAAGKYRDISE